MITIMWNVRNPLAVDKREACDGGDLKEVDSGWKVLIGRQNGMEDRQVGEWDWFEEQVYTGWVIRMLALEELRSVYREWSEPGEADDQAVEGTDRGRIGDVFVYPLQ